MFQVGSASVCITPPVGSFLQGQFNERVMVDVHDDLFAKAVVVDDGSTRVALVSCDIISLTHSTLTAARDAVQRLAGIPGENVMICVTHTHEGPVVGGRLSPEEDPGPVLRSGFTTPLDVEYVAMLPRWIASAVCLASRRLAPARLGAGSGREERATFNRRFLDSAGGIRMHGSAPADVEIVGPEGPTDPEVGVLFAEDEAGRLLTAAVNFTCHPTAAGHETVASADYCGYLTGALARAKRCTGEVLFVNGAAANAGPVGRYSPDRREYGFDRCEYIGNLVAAEALRVIETTEPHENGRLRVATETLELPIREITPAMLDEARRVRDDESAGLVDRVFGQETLLLDAIRRRKPTETAEVQAMSFGDAAFVSIPAEFFVEFGLEIKRRSPVPRTFIAGYTNGVIGYIPTALAFSHGGYETRLARSSKIVPEGGDLFVEAALRALGRVAG
jgi:neutral ceramidase